MNDGDAEEVRGELKKPFLHTGSWYRMNPGAGKEPLPPPGPSMVIGSRQSSIFGVGIHRQRNRQLLRILGFKSPSFRCLGHCQMWEQWLVQLLVGRFLNTLAGKGLW